MPIDSCIKAFIARLDSPLDCLVTSVVANRISVESNFIKTKTTATPFGPATLQLIQPYATIICFIKIPQIAKFNFTIQICCCCSSYRFFLFFLQTSFRFLMEELCWFVGVLICLLAFSFTFVSLFVCPSVVHGSETGFYR